MKKSIVLCLFGILVLLTGCATQRTVIQTQPIHIKPIDSRGVGLFIDGVIDDLNQNYASALLAYQEALLYDSTSAVIYLDIAKDYIRLGKDDSAVLSLKQCLHFDIKCNEARELLANIYVSQGELEEVEKAYTGILRYDSTRTDVLYNLALLCQRMNKKDEAIDIYQRILSSQESVPTRVYMSLGEIYIDKGQYEEAMAVFQKLVTSKPDEAFGYYGLGLAKEALKDTSGAMENYRKSIDLLPEFAEAREQLGRLYFSKGMWNDALELFTQAVALDSSDIANWLLLGEIYWEKRDSLLAVQTYAEIKHRFPKDWRPYFNLGQIYLDTRQPDLAFHEFKNVTRLSEDTHLGWLYSGISMLLQDSLEASVSYLEKALSFVPEDPLGNFYLGSAFDQLNRTKEAIPYYKNAIRVRSKWMAALSALAAAYDKLKMYVYSDSVFQQALQLDSENALLLNNYGYSLSERGVRLKEAMTMAQKALTKDPDNGAYLDTVGWIYYKMGDYENALEYIKKACEQRENNAVVVEHLGDVYFKLQMKKEAQSSWEEALKLNQDNPELKEKLNHLDAEPHP
jgi:tetratricopeptide (TPR) repeat protein